LAASATGTAVSLIGHKLAGNRSLVKSNCAARRSGVSAERR
jgi:hypothetical protein